MYILLLLKIVILFWYKIWDFLLDQPGSLKIVFGQDLKTKHSIRELKE